MSQELNPLREILLLRMQPAVGSCWMELSVPEVISETNAETKIDTDTDTLTKAIILEHSSPKASGLRNVARTCLSCCNIVVAYSRETLFPSLWCHGGCSA